MKFDYNFIHLRIFLHSVLGSSGVRVSAFTFPTRNVRRGTVHPHRPLCSWYLHPAFYTFLPVESNQFAT